MTSDVSAVLVGAVCYGLSTVFEIRFTNRTTVPTAAALAPAVAMATLEMLRVGARPHIGLVFLPTALAGALHFAAGRRVRDFVRDTGNFACTVALMHGLAVTGATDPLARALVGGLFYLSAQYAVQRLVAGKRLLRNEDLKTWLMLHGVLVCACGLTSLAVREMDWPAFVAMAFVLVLTKREFEGFAMSRMSYEQTLRAVGRLKSLESPQR